MNILEVGPRYMLGNLFNEVEEVDRVFQFNERRNPWQLNDRKFVKLFRLTKPVARDLVHTLEPLLPYRNRASSIPSDTRVLTALRFFSCGSYQDGIGQDFNIGLSQQSVSNCIHNVLDAMAPLIENYIQFPRTPNVIDDIKWGFWDKYGFPGVIGAIDGTHVAIVAPPKNDPRHPEHAYINRKRFHSINTQIIADSDRRILSIWPKYPGRSHDAYIWQRSAVRRFLHRLHDEGDHNTWLIGDSGYPLEQVLMKGYINTLPGTPQRRYSRALTSARSSVECTIGMLKNRWRCLLKHRTLHYYPTTASKIITCCAALHNICIREDIPLIYNNGELEILDNVEDNAYLENNDVDAINVRNQIVNTFFI